MGSDVPLYGVEARKVSPNPSGRHPDADPCRPESIRGGVPLPRRALAFPTGKIAQDGIPAKFDFTQRVKKA